MAVQQKNLINWIELLKKISTVAFGNLMRKQLN